MKSVRTKNMAEAGNKALQNIKAALEKGSAIVVTNDNGIYVLTCWVRVRHFSLYTANSKTKTKEKALVEALDLSEMTAVLICLHNL